MSKQPKYKVGDRVVVISSPFYCDRHGHPEISSETRAMEGKVCEIKGYYAETYWHVYNPNKTAFYAFDESSLAPVKKRLWKRKPQPEFTVSSPNPDLKLNDPTPETLTIEGKTYRKEDVIERLVGLEEA